MVELGREATTAVEDRFLFAIVGQIARVGLQGGVVEQGDGAVSAQRLQRRSVPHTHSRDTDL